MLRASRRRSNPWPSSIDRWFCQVISWYRERVGAARGSVSFHSWAPRRKMSPMRWTEFLPATSEHRKLPTAPESIVASIQCLGAPKVAGRCPVRFKAYQVLEAKKIPLMPPWMPAYRRRVGARGLTGAPSRPRGARRRRDGRRPETRCRAAWRPISWWPARDGQEACCRQAKSGASLGDIDDNKQGSANEIPVSRVSPQSAGSVVPI